MISKAKIRRYIPSAAMIAVGIGLSVLAFFVVHHREYREIELSFQQDAAERYDSLKREIEFDLQSLEAITAFYQASKGVERSEFRSFVKPLLDRHQSIQALEWIPRVSASQRETYEGSARRDGFPTFHITERDTQGRMVRARERDDYFPVYFVEPYKRNEAALGFDLASNPTREASGLRPSQVFFYFEPKGQLPFHVVSPPLKEWWLLKHQPYGGERQQLYAHGGGGQVIRAGEIVGHREEGCSPRDRSMPQG